MRSGKFIIAILLAISILLSSVSLASAKTSSPKPGYWQWLSAEVSLSKQDFFAPSSLPEPNLASNQSGATSLQNNNLDVPPQGTYLLWNPFTKWCFPVGGSGGRGRYTYTPGKMYRFYGGFSCVMAKPGFGKT